MLAFNTLADAYNWFIKSDFRDFGWFPGFHEDQLVQFYATAMVFVSNW